MSSPDIQLGPSESAYPDAEPSVPGDTSPSQAPSVRTGGNQPVLMPQYPSSLRAEAHEDDIAYLMARSRFGDFVRFVRTRATDQDQDPETKLISEWRRANDTFAILESQEAQIADDPDIFPLPENMQEIARTQLALPEAQRSFQPLHHEWHLVEIDRLVVSQSHLNLRYSNHLISSLSRRPTPESLIRLATGLEPVDQPTRVTRQADHIFSLSCASSDLRFLETAVLPPETIQGHTPCGRASAVIAVYVGFGVNFISAVKVGTRLALLNGTHRAHAMRSLGVRYIPCLIRYVSREDELEIVGANELRAAAQIYLRSPRPPLFKDYFEPQLSKVIRVPRTDRVLHLQLNMQQWRSPFR